MQNKKELLIKILEAKAVFDKFLLNYDYKYIYKNCITNKIEFFEMKCMPNNFLHLTGVKTKLTGSNFYSSLQNKKISYNDIDYREDGTTKLKLEIFKRINLLVSTPVQISIQDNFFTLKLNVDILINRPKKEEKDIILGLKQHKNFDFFVPASLLKERANKFGNNFSQVLFILKKSKNEKDYSSICYKSKNEVIDPFSY